MFGGRGNVGARRCSQCSIDYPPLEAHKICEVCESETNWFSNIEPDPEWEEAVRFARMNPADPAERLDERGWRLHQYLEMHFTGPQAERLADAKHGPHALPLYPAKVRAVLEAGLDRDEAFDLFT